MSERTKRYKSTIEQLERAVLSLSTSASGSGPHDGSSASASQLAVAQTIQNHQNAILNLAAHLENLQIRMNALRGSYAEEYRSRTGSMRDPFDVAREEKAFPQCGYKRRASLPRRDLAFGRTSEALISAFMHVDDLMYVEFDSWTLAPVIQMVYTLSHSDCERSCTLTAAVSPGSRCMPSVPLSRGSRRGIARPSS